MFAAAGLKQVFGYEERAETKFTGRFSLRLLSFDLEALKLDQLLIQRVDSDKIYGNILPGSK